MNTSKNTLASKVDSGTPNKPHIADKLQGVLKATCIASPFFLSTDIRIKVLYTLLLVFIEVRPYIFQVIINRIYIWRVEKAFNINISELQNQLDICHKKCDKDELKIELTKLKRDLRNFRIEKIREI